jgi:hypothetical protein
MEIKREKLTIAVVGYICDKCGNRIVHDDHQSESHCTFDAWYGSEFDGDCWKLDLCEDCWWLVYAFVTGLPKPSPREQSKFLRHRQF